MNLYRILYNSNVKIKYENIIATFNWIKFNLIEKKSVPNDKIIRNHSESTNF